MGKTRFPGITFNDKPLEDLFTVEVGGELRDEMQSQSRMPLYHKPRIRMKQRQPRPSKVRIIKKGDDPMKELDLTKEALKFATVTDKALYVLWSHRGPIDRTMVAEYLPGLHQPSISATLCKAGKLPWVNVERTTIGNVYEVTDDAPKDFETVKREFNNIGKEYETSGANKWEDDLAELQEAVGKSDQATIPSGMAEVTVEEFLWFFESIGYIVDITIRRK